MPRRRHADNHRRAADRHHGVGAVHRAGGPDGDEDIIRPAAGHLADLAVQLFLGGQKRVGGAESPGDLKFFFRDVDDDDFRCARQRRALHSVQPDAASADYDRGGARGQLGRVCHRAVTGDHAARHQRGFGPADIAVQPGELRMMHRRALGEGAGRQALRHGRARCVRQGRADADETLSRAIAARAGRAARAFAAAPQEGDQNPVADGERRVVADGRDDARRFVPEHHGRQVGPAAVDIDQVGMADRHRLDVDLNIALAGPCEVEILDDQWRFWRA